MRRGSFVVRPIQTKALIFPCGIWLNYRYGNVNRKYVSVTEIVTLTSLLNYSHWAEAYCFCFKSYPRVLRKIHYYPIFLKLFCCIANLLTAQVSNTSEENWCVFLGGEQRVQVQEFTLGWYRCEIWGGALPLCPDGSCSLVLVLESCCLQLRALGRSPVSTLMLWVLLNTKHLLLYDALPTTLIHMDTKSRREDAFRDDINDCGVYSSSDPWCGLTNCSCFNDDSGLC